MGSGRRHILREWHLCFSLQGHASALSGKPEHHQKNRSKIYEIRFDKEYEPGKYIKFNTRRNRP